LINKLINLLILLMEIQGFPDYLIYDDGRVWSNISNKFLSGGKNTKGYLLVGLINGGKRINKLIHRLVAEHFIPNPENKPQVDHIDRNKTNNNIENLRWATPQENEENKGKRKDNTSGFKNISWYNNSKSWRFYVHGRYKKQRYFKSKIDCICYKFYYLLKINLLNKKFD
jgi:hypothetical protein